MDPKKVRQIAIAIYIVNRHAKTAPDNALLYSLKKKALEKLLTCGQAEKVGLHFVDNPKHSKQHSTVLIRCQDYLFHTIPEKEDFAKLPHLGQQDRNIRNPQERMSLKQARELLKDFTNYTQSPVQTVSKKPVKKAPFSNNPTSFRSSYLDGK